GGGGQGVGRRWERGGGVPPAPQRRTRRWWAGEIPPATFGAATGSPEKAIRAGPFRSGAIDATSEPSRAILASRFLATFTLAPACFICRRSVCIWATVRPE